MKNHHGGYELLEFIAEYYDISYQRRNSIDIEFFVDYARKSGERTLELGCGTGTCPISCWKNAVKSWPGNRMTYKNW